MIENKLDFAWPITTVEYDDFKKLQGLINNNLLQFKNRKIAIFGAGIRGSMFAVILNKIGYSDFIFVDNNSEKCGGFINKHPIISFNELIDKKDEYMVIISTENSDAIKQQLLGCGFAEGVHFFDIQTNAYDKYMEEFKRQVDAKYLVLGDCGLTQISIHDNKIENLSEMIKASLGYEVTKVLAIHGMGMRGYYNVFNAQICYGLRPVILIIMLNLEVFTGKHHILPRTQHAILIRRIWETLGNPDTELSEYVNLTAERSNSFITDVFSQRQPSISEENLNAKLLLKMNYMYKMRRDTEDIEYMLKILDLAKRNKVCVAPFIPPVNYIYAKRCLGEVFNERYTNNLALIKQYVAEQLRHEVLDLSFCLSDNCFADINTIDETANYSGRKVILKHLIEYINNIE